VEVVTKSLMYSVVASSGFVTAVLVAYAGLLRSGSGKREIGTFGRFMVIVECLDAIPEAAVLADATANGSMTWSFVISIFSLNLANTLASAIDIQATRTSHTLHRILFVSIFVAVGMLSYTIPMQVYAAFANMWDEDEKGWEELLSLIGGTLTGATLIILLLFLDSKAHAAISKKNAHVPKMVKIRQSAQMLQEAYAAMTMVDEADVVDDYEARDINEDADWSEYQTKRNKKIQENVENLEKVLETIKLLKKLEKTMGRQGRAIVGDTTDIVHEIILEEALPILQQSQSLHLRAFKMLLTMLTIAFWSAIMTSSLAIGFYYLSEANHTAVSIMDSYAEGLSGGAFLATIAGTMIPRIQQDAYRASWSKEKSKIIGLICYEMGLMAVVFLDVFF